MTKLVHTPLPQVFRLRGYCANPSCGTRNRPLFCIVRPAMKSRLAKGDVLATATNFASVVAQLETQVS